MPQQNSTQISTPEVLVCRPQEAGSQLVQLLSDNCISSLHLPTLTIEPININLSYSVDNFTDVIFTSTNAVRHLPIHIIKKLVLANNCNVWSIGSATHDILMEYGLKSIYPIKGQNSEELLKLIQKKTSDQTSSFLLVKGCGGRKLLQNCLSVSHYVVILESYKRLFNSGSLQLNILAETVTKKPPIICIFTSFDSLLAAMPIFRYYDNWKRESIITVTNKRMSMWAENNGFEKIELLGEISNDYLLELCKKYLTRT